MTDTPQTLSCPRCHGRGGYYDGMVNGGEFALRCECGAPVDPRRHFRFEDPIAFAARLAERERHHAEVAALFASDDWLGRPGEQLLLISERT